MLVDSSIHYLEKKVGMEIVIEALQQEKMMPRN
jgi:hypothetical protein